MSDDSESPEREGNPLAGVLDRLLNRERGGSSEPAEVPPRDSKVRRMLAVAGLGPDGGETALRSAVQWATLLGRRPAITDLCCGEPLGEAAPTPAGEGRVPRARVPRELELVRREPAEVVLALLERLRRHEFASDLSLVRIPVRQRRTLMRAAFLAGALVVPVDDESEADFRLALEVSREVLENFLEISVWPFSKSQVCLERFLSALSDVSSVRASSFDPGRLDLAAALEALPAPPREGYLVGLLAPEPAALPEGLLSLDSVEL